MRALAAFSGASSSALAASVVALFALAPASALASPSEAYGFGSRESGMGGAVSAETRGFAANYYNPAALVRSRGLDVGVGYFHASHALEMNGKDNHVDPVRGVVGGLVVPGTLFDVPVAFGLALHLPDQRLSRVRSLPQEQPRWELYDNRGQRLFFAVNVAIAPAPWLELGGGMAFLSATKGRLDISGSTNVFDADAAKLRHEVDADLTSVRYPQAGARVKLSDRVALAAVYRGEFRLDVDLSAHIFGDVSGLTTALYDLQTRSVSNFLPQQVVLGGSWELLRGLKTTLDVTWIDWSAYVAPTTDVDIRVEVPEPAGGWPPNVEPPTTPTRPRIEPLRLHDRVVPRVGLEWNALRRRSFDAFLRGGLEVAKSPIPPQTGVTNYVDRDRTTLSVGAGIALRELVAELPGALSLDAHLQWSTLATETTRKSSPVDYVGDYSAGGSILNVGVTAGFAFDAKKREERR